MILDCLTVGPLGENCYLIGAAPRAAIVDPGAESERIADRLGEFALEPEAILLTHGHVDHIAHCAQLAERFGIGVRVHRADLHYLQRPQWRELEALLGAQPCPAPEAFFEDGETVEIAGLALRVLHTPGHTPGGVCFVHEASRSILVGDTIFCRGIGRTDLPGGDLAALERSIRERLFELPGDYTLWPGHGPQTTLQEERIENPFFGARARFTI